jgi:hypothetical protein
MLTVFVQCFRTVQWPYGSPHAYPCLLDLFSVSEESTCVLLVLMKYLLCLYSDKRYYSESLHEVMILS